MAHLKSCWGSPTMPFDIVRCGCPQSSLGQWCVVLEADASPRGRKFWCLCLIPAASVFHWLRYRLLRDNLKHFYLPNLSHHFKLLSHICVPCPRSYLAYATLISTFYYYYYYYYYYYLGPRTTASASPQSRPYCLGLTLVDMVNGWAT